MLTIDDNMKTAFVAILFRLIYKHRSEEIYPSMTTASMTLTLSVTVASDERSFSKLKIT